MTETLTTMPTTNLPELFTVNSNAGVTINGNPDVPVDWYVERRAEPWPELSWHQIVEPDAAGCGYTRAAVEELFTRDEAHALVKYLKNFRNVAVTVRPFKLPITGCLVPLAHDDEGITFRLEDPDGALPFAVRGYCCKRASLPIGNPSMSEPEDELPFVSHCEINR